VVLRLTRLAQFGPIAVQPELGGSTVAPRRARRRGRDGASRSRTRPCRTRSRRHVGA